MAQRYTVTWGEKGTPLHGNGTPGFGTREAAERFIDRVCKTVAPGLEYRWVQEF